MNPLEETDGSEPFNIPSLNNSQLHLDQEEGFRVMHSPDKLRIGNPVNCIRDMNEADRGRAQSTPIVDLTWLPNYPLMTRNVAGETFQTHAHPAMVNISNVNIGSTKSNSSRIPQTYTRSISGEGNAYNRFSPSLSLWDEMSGTDEQQIGIDMSALGANMNSAYQIPATKERITRTAGTKLRPYSSTDNSIHGPQVHKNMFRNMNTVDRNHGQQDQMVGTGGPDFRPNLDTARGGYRPRIDKTLPMVGAGMNSGYQNADQELMLRTGISNFRTTLTGLHGSQGDRNMVTAGANINLSYQNHEQKEQRASNKVAIAVPYDNSTCHPTLGFGDHKLPSCLSGGICRRTPSDDVIANNSSYRVLGQQVDRNFLPLGKNFGDPSLLNDALNPASEANMFSLNTSQAPEAFLQPSYPIKPGSRINRSSRDINLNSSGQSQGYSDADSGQIVPMRTGLIANEQARRAIIQRMSRSAAESLNFVPAPVYHANMGNTLISNSKVFPSLGSTSASGQTGQPVNVRFLQAQQATSGAVPVPLTGKRSPVGVNMSQSFKHLRGPSAAGPPVPMRNRKAVTADPATYKRVNKRAVDPVQVLPNVNPSSAVTKSPLYPRAEPAKLLSSLPYLEHIRWKDPDASNHIIEEKCGICKRNLLYAAKGDYVQLSLPPASAVFPCGHVYHDECLKGVTPLEQAKEPPCISCWTSDS